MSSVIAVRRLGKAYRRYKSRWARLVEWFIGWERCEQSWVLRDVSFEVAPGEAVGVLGINGAGKSTLLKIITGTTKATEGDVEIRGRVTAILELGMGFHPDFSGRQNAIMSGQLFGYTLDEIESVMAEIESFANIGTYFDQPVRIYSSGMQARVAFAVATSVLPDVLIVDEALSVGDVAFQAKCLLRMQSLLERGASILFVSHSPAQVRQFCSRALLLSDGKLMAIGAAADVCDLYQNATIGNLPNSVTVPLQNEAHGSRLSTYEEDAELRANSIDAQTGTMDLAFSSFDILNCDGLPISTCTHGDVIFLKASVVANRTVPKGAAIGLLIADKTGYPLAACNTNYYDQFLPAMAVGERIVVQWKIEFPFASGEFRIDIGIKPSVFENSFYDRVFCAKTLSVTPRQELLDRNFGGYLYVDAAVCVGTPTRSS